MIGPVSSRKPAAFVSLGPELISKLKLQDQTPVEVLVGYGKDIGKVQLVFGPNQNFTVLARKEAVVFLRRLFQILPDIEVSGPPQFVHSNFVNAVSSLPVEFTPAAPLPL